MVPQGDISSCTTLVEVVVSANGALCSAEGLVNCCGANLLGAACLSGSVNTGMEELGLSLPLLSEPTLLGSLALMVPAIPEDPTDSKVFNLALASTDVIKHAGDLFFLASSLVEEVVVLFLVAFCKDCSSFLSTRPPKM